MVIYPDTPAWALNEDEPLRQQTQPQVSAGYNTENVGGFSGSKFQGGLGGHPIFELHDSLDYYSLRAWSGILFEENLYVRGIIRRLITNIIHTGLELEAAPMARVLGVDPDSLREWKQTVEDRFSLWSDFPELCDYSRRVEGTLAHIHKSAKIEAFIGGDALVVLHMDAATGLPRVKIHPGSDVVSPGQLDDIPEGHRVEHGVQLDRTGQPVAYFVRAPNLAEPPVRVNAIGASGRRVAWLVYGCERRVGQIRGTPLISGIIQSLREIDRYRVSTQRKALVNSMFAMWVERTKPSTPSFPGKGATNRTADISQATPTGNTEEYTAGWAQPGIFVDYLADGEKPHPFTASGTDEKFGDFEATIIAAVAWHLQIPPTVLRLSFDRNYAASMAELNEFVAFLAMEQENEAVSFNRPIYREWLVNEVSRGKISAPGFLESLRDPQLADMRAAWLRADFLGSVKPVSDPVKTAKAVGELLDRGLTNHTKAARQLTGTKFERNMEKLREERELLATLPPIAAPVAPAPAPAPAPEEDESNDPDSTDSTE